MASQEYERFQSSFLDDDSGAERDGLDTEALAALSGDERKSAESQLLRKLPDVRGIIGLGVLRSQRAVPELTKIFERERPLLSYKLIAAAAALWRVAPDARYLDAVIDTLENAASSERRTEAALTLWEFHDPAAVPPLVRAMDDEDVLVRHHAARALLVIHGIPNGPGDPQHPIARVMSPDDGTHAAAKDAILRMIAGRPLAP